MAQILMRESDEVTYLPEYLDSYEFAAVFPKGEAGKALKDQFNAFLDQLPEGALDELAQKWFGEDEDAKTMPDLAALNAANGTLRLATESGYVPFEYVRDGDVVGYDMDLAARFCEYAGYGLEIVDMNFDGILPAVQAGQILIPKCLQNCLCRSSRDLTLIFAPVHIAGCQGRSPRRG